MKKRYIYSLLFMLPGLTIAFLITMTVFAIVFGTLWLYVFGDGTWPTWLDPLMSILILIVFSGLWMGAIVAGYLIGKQLEIEPGFNLRHLWISLGATMLPIILVLLHQLSIGNLGPKPAGQLCGEYCGDLGYVASSMSPQTSGNKTCSCLGQHGEVEITLPIDELPR